MILTVSRDNEILYFLTEITVCTVSAVAFFGGIFIFVMFMAWIHGDDI